MNQQWSRLPQSWFNLPDDQKTFSLLRLTRIPSLDKPRIGNPRIVPTRHQVPPTLMARSRTNIPFPDDKKRAFRSTGISFRSWRAQWKCSQLLFNGVKI
jgi:hypothetical protein